MGTGTVASLKAIIDDEGYQSDERNVRVSDQYQYLQYARSVGPVQDMDFVKKTLLDTFTKRHLEVLVQMKRWRKWRQVSITIFRNY